MKFQGALKENDPKKRFSIALFSECFDVLLYLKKMRKAKESFPKGGEWKERKRHFLYKSWVSQLWCPVYELGLATPGCRPHSQEKPSLFLCPCTVITWLGINGSQASSEADKKPAGTGRFISCGLLSGTTCGWGVLQAPCNLSAYLAAGWWALDHGSLGAALHPAPSQGTRSLFNEYLSRLCKMGTASAKKESILGSAVPLHTYRNCSWK